jgi:hypothetical protein
MASSMSGNTSVIYGLRDSLNLQAKINEGKTFGPEGAKTDLIQKLALSALPGEDQLSVLRQSGANRANAKDKPGFTALLTAAPTPKKEPATTPVQFANVYRNTKGFGAVA